MNGPIDHAEAAAWPAVPGDATFLSEFLASARYSGSLPKYHAKRYFEVSQYQGNLFAFGAGAFVERAFGGHTDPEWIVRHRSPFTIFASLLSAGDEAAWLTSLIAGDQATARAFRPATKTGRLTASSYRSCGECVANDRSAFGVGHWHVLHQIPALTRCPLHRVELHDQCGACGAPLGGPRLGRLPGDRCIRCGSAATAAKDSMRISRGYEALEALMVRAADGEAPELRPAVRMRIMDRIIFRRLGEHGIQRAVQAFLAAWEVDAAGDLERVLGCVVSERLLVGLFSGIDTGCSRYLQMAVVAFALQHATPEDLEVCLTGEHCGDGIEDLFQQHLESYADPDLVRELCRTAAEVGFPMKGARALAAGKFPRELAAPNAINRFLESLPTIANARCLDTRVARALGRAPLTRNVVRERIICALSAGCTTRWQLQRVASPSYKWALRNDSEWLDQVLPSPSKCAHRSWGSAGRAAVREALLAAMKEGANTRSLLLGRRFRAYQWAAKNDAEWLDLQIASLINVSGVPSNADVFSP